jgi:hypothetical protein
VVAVDLPTGAAELSAATATALAGGAGLTQRSALVKAHQVLKVNANSTISLDILKRFL